MNQKIGGSYWFMLSQSSGPQWTFWFTDLVWVLLSSLGYIGFWKSLRRCQSHSGFPTDSPSAALQGEPSYISRTGASRKVLPLRKQKGVETFKCLGSCYFSGTTQVSSEGIQDQEAERRDLQAWLNWLGSIRCQPLQICLSFLSSLLPKKEIKWTQKGT